MHRGQAAFEKFRSRRMRESFFHRTQPEFTGVGRDAAMHLRSRMDSRLVYWGYLLGVNATCPRTPGAGRRCRKLVQMCEEQPFSRVPQARLEFQRMVDMQKKRDCYICICYEQPLADMQPVGAKRELPVDHDGKRRVTNLYEALQSDHTSLVILPVLLGSGVYRCPVATDVCNLPSCDTTAT